uniref:RNA-dependent RNA-polymerase n=1 Tax=Norway luteo-like virus 3 TaxID=2034333 RepID=A0A286N600_9LUTE|nr:RNA-dependent RNA-polymerase [Norway luteo-like virus 3]
MHLGAAVDNLGYDGSYLACKIRRFTEDSTEYFERLTRQHQKRGKRLVVRRTQDPQEVEVRVNGQYVRISRAAVEAVYESFGAEPDYAPESGKRGGALCKCAGPWADEWDTFRCTEPQPAKFYPNRELQQRFEDDGQYGIPNIDSCSTKKSFAHHVNIREQRNEGGPGDAVFEGCLDDLEQAFSEWRFQPKLEREEVARAIRSLEFTSTPGYCQFSGLGTTNGEILGWNGVECTRVDVLEALEQAALDRLQDLSNGKIVSDPIKLFVKQEPHKMSKIREGRLRLISAISLVDQVVDRVLFGRLQQQALTKVGRTPCMVGWSPASAGGYRTMRARLRGDVLCADKSAWDWTVVGWQTDLLLGLVLALAETDDPRWETAVKSRFRALFEEALFQFSDGQQVEQQCKGIMKSGWFLTIMANSVWQVALHFVVQRERGLSPWDHIPYAMGDDTVQEVPDYLEDYLERLGRYCILKPKVVKEIEFCGFEMTENWVRPCYQSKHRFLLRHLDEATAAETLESYQYLYAFDDTGFRDQIRSILGTRDPTRLRSVRYLQRWVDGLVT